MDKQNPITDKEYQSYAQRHLEDLRRGFVGRHEDRLDGPEMVAEYTAEFWQCVIQEVVNSEKCGLSYDDVRMMIEKLLRD